MKRLCEMKPDLRLRWVLILAVVACGLWIPSSARGESPIQVQDSTHSFAFGQHVRFHLTVASTAPIQSIVLAYRTSDNRETTIETLDFDRGLSVNVDYVHDMAQRYIRPFVDVTYWWTITNDTGEVLTTEPQAFPYTDNRFDWQVATDGIVNVYWYRGDAQVAQQAVDAAVAGLDRARLDIEVHSLRKPVDIYLYADPDALRPALPAGLPSGAEALTLYETNVILIPFGPEAGNLPHLARILPHEVTHVLLHEATQSDFDHIPRWLSEGLATSVEYAFTPDPDTRTLLQEASQTGQTIELDTLCAAFPPDPASARLAYAESASMIDDIRNIHGRQALRDLVAAYADGATCEGGVQRVLGISLDQLEASWLDRLAPQGRWAVFWKEGGPWMVILIMFVSLFCLSARTFYQSAPGAEESW